MEPPRSRRESQAQTRLRLMEVASDEFLEGGYRATSLERVAETAGFSQGAVYSNFAGKEDLVLAVLDQHFVHRLDNLRPRCRPPPRRSRPGRRPSRHGGSPWSPTRSGGGPTRQLTQVKVGFTTTSVRRLLAT